MKYLTFPLGLCIALFEPYDPAKTTDALGGGALMDALRQGYRWVRTDGDLAIFELDEILAEAPTFQKFGGGTTINLGEVVAYEFVSGGDLRVALRGGAEFCISQNPGSAYEILDRYVFVETYRS